MNPVKKLFAAMLAAGICAPAAPEDQPLRQMGGRVRAGFVYDFELVRGGQVVDRWQQHNLMPTEGLNYLLNILFKGTSPAAAWYIALYEGDYTPVDEDVAADFATNATECTAYTPSTRPAFTAGTVSGGAVDNSASVAEFTFTSDKTIYGGSMHSVATKSALTGTLLSAVKFASPKTCETGDVLRVTAGLTFTST